MYRIKVKNLNTGYEFYEYGFSGWMMKRVQFLFHQIDCWGNPTFEILDIVILCLTLDTLKKCLTNVSVPIRIDSKKER
jgi:hypothetical protein